MALERLCRALKVLKNKKGYALLAVLCSLLVFTTLGTNTLLAAQASAGAIAKKQDDTQAYALAASAAVFISGAIERGDFSEFIRQNVMTAGAGNTVTVATDFALPETTENVKITIDFTMSSIEEIGATGFYTGPLTTRITAAYRTSQFALAADFNHLVVSAAPLESKWDLVRYRNDRVQAIIPPQIPPP